MVYHIARNWKKNAECQAHISHNCVHSRQRYSEIALTPTFASLQIKSDIHKLSRAVAYRRLLGFCCLQLLSLVLKIVLNLLRLSLPPLFTGVTAELPCHLFGQSPVQSSTT